MADPLDVLPFKTLVAQAGAVLLTHGFEVEPVSVEGVATHLAETMARQVGMDLAEAVYPATETPACAAISALVSGPAARPSTERPRSVEDVPGSLDSGANFSKTRCSARFLLFQGLDS